MMTGTSIGLKALKVYLKRADTATSKDENSKAKKDGVLSSEEIQNRITTLQDNPNKRQQKELDFLQKIMTGNDGGSFFDLMEKLDEAAGISKKDLRTLATLGNNEDPKNKLKRLDDNDFLALKNGYTQPAKKDPKKPDSQSNSDNSLWSNGAYT